MSDCTVYIDEAGDLGCKRGTRWFVLSAVIVEKDTEKTIRKTMEKIKCRLNVNEIHLRKITDFYKRAYLINELDNQRFTYINVIADTDQLEYSKILSPAIVYNLICEMLLERVSWHLTREKRTADIVLSARGTSRDKELINYLEKQLGLCSRTQAAGLFSRISAKASNSWDMLQLADVCATTAFLAYEINGWGFRTPCYYMVLNKHLCQYCGETKGYGLNYFTVETMPTPEKMLCNIVCKKEKRERNPGVTST